jgi:hypothetical protein
MKEWEGAFEECRSLTFAHADLLARCSDPCPSRLLLSHRRRFVARYLAHYCSLLHTLKDVFISHALLLIV